MEKLIKCEHTIYYTSCRVCDILKGVDVEIQLSKKKCEEMTHGEKFTEVCRLVTKKAVIDSRYNIGDFRLELRKITVEQVKDNRYKIHCQYEEIKDK